MTWKLPLGKELVAGSTEHLFSNSTMKLFPFALMLALFASIAAETYTENWTRMPWSPEEPSKVAGW